MEDWNLYILFGVGGFLFMFFSTCFFYYKRKDVLRRKDEKLFEAERDDTISWMWSSNNNQEGERQSVNQNNVSASRTDVDVESISRPVRNNELILNSVTNEVCTVQNHNPQTSEEISSASVSGSSQSQILEVESRIEMKEIRANEDVEEGNGNVDFDIDTDRGFVNPAFDSTYL